MDRRIKGQKKADSQTDGKDRKDLKRQADKSDVGNRETDRQTGRQTGRQTDRQADRQADGLPLSSFLLHEW